MTTWSLNMLNIAEQYNLTGVFQPGEPPPDSGGSVYIFFPFAMLITATIEAIYQTYEIKGQEHIRDTLPFEVVARTTGAELPECSKYLLTIAQSSLSNSIQTSYRMESFLPVEPAQTRFFTHIDKEGQVERYSSQLQAQRLREISGLTIEQVASIFGVSRVTLHKWLEGSQLSDRHREHLLEVLPLVEETLQRTGSPNALSTWLLTPVSPGGKKPIEYLSSRQYNTFRGFLLRQGAGRHLLHPPLSLGITYRKRPQEEIEDELARLHARILLDEDYPDATDNDE